MTDLTSLGYPQGYHLGFSAVIWWISIAVSLFLGTKLYFKARKSDLVNVKDMLRAKAITFIVGGINHSLLQIIVFFPSYFLQVRSLGLLLASFSFTFYYYNWEKYLTTINRIPTISTGVATIVALIEFIIIIFIPDVFDLSYNLLNLIYLLLLVVASVLYIYLIFIFSRNVKGVSRTVSWIWMGGMVLTHMYFIIEFPPGAGILPEFIVYYFPSVLLMVGMSMTYYGINTLFTHISSYYAQTQKCAVHRGIIEKGNPIHYCSSCGIVYCEQCFNEVIKKDGCWNCRKSFEPESKKKLFDDPIIELKEHKKVKDDLAQKMNNKPSD
jgi:hypothetical protein